MQSTRSKLQSFDFDTQKKKSKRKTPENRVQRKSAFLSADSDLGERRASPWLFSDDPLGVDDLRFYSNAVFHVRSDNLSFFYFITKYT